MRQIVPYSMWLGHAGDARDLRRVLSAGIAALVDLALNEPPVVVTRDLVYCRFPLIDGAGNPAWLLRAALEVMAGFLRRRTPQLICCSNGMSRSPALAAGALALAEGKSLRDCLASVARFGPADVSPSLWNDVVAAIEDATTGTAVRPPSAHELDLGEEMGGDT
jgi:hypothetical protein